jgi:anti-anti-sigma factor
VTVARERSFLDTGGETARLIRAHDWATSPLGPVQAWPQELCTAVALLLESPHPMLLWWGPELTLLYNDAAVPLLGDVHPAALGRPGHAASPGIWPAVGPLLRGVLGGGEPTRVDDQLVLVERAGFVEETYWTCSFSPVRGDDGHVQGVFAAATNTTPRVIGQRRLDILRMLSGVAAARSTTVDQAVAAALDAFATNPAEVPFAAVYRCPSTGGPPRLTASAGIPADEKAAALAAAAELAVRTGEPHETGSAVALPLTAADDDPPAVLVLGTNPHRPLDEDGRAFLELVAGQVAAAVDAARADAARRRAEQELVRFRVQRRRAEQELYAERERYRTLVAQAPVGIWTADPSGATTFANENAAVLRGGWWSEVVHPDDRAAIEESWAAAVRAGTAWQREYRVVTADGAVRHVTSSARPLHDADGAVTGFLGTSLDVTEQRRAELAHRDMAAEHAARQVADAASARLRAMVEGLAAIVWEADWDAQRRVLRFTFISERAEELLGYTAAELRDDETAWPRMIHPDDREEAIRFSLDRVAAGRDHDLAYRAVAIDGRVVWLHQVVHVVRAPDGTPLRVQGLAVDITEQKRAERSSQLLAETGRLVADDGTVEEKLAALARIAVHDLGEGVVVSLTGPDGLLRRAAVAHDDAAVERALLRLAPTKLPPELVEALAPGRPVLVPVTEELNRSAARDAADADARLALGVRSTLVVPLVAHGHVLGLLGFVNFTQRRYYDQADLELAEELGRRAALMLENDRQRTHERQMQQVSAALASAGSVPEAAQRLVDGLGEVLGASAVSVYAVEPDRGVRLVHATGYSPSLLSRYELMRFDEDVPLAHVARTGEAIWISDRQEWVRRWPHLLGAAEASGRHAAATLPLHSGGRTMGAIGLSFGTPRAFPPDERAFTLALVALAAPTFERAAAADERRQIAETLQKSLLPPMLPDLPGLTLAARYLPGAHGTAAGGDWYDVLPLGDTRVAVAVGDVVGQGARAAAVMGQLRSALSGYLLEGHGPVRALELLDLFAARVGGATGSTVACLVLDVETGGLTWARAGHPPPLVVGPTGPRYLDDAVGTVLCVRKRAPFEAGHARLAPGESVVLYTDGLVERRDEVIDRGFDRLAEVAGAGYRLSPGPLADALLEGSLVPTGPSDDVAVVVVRRMPAPLRMRLRAEGAQLRSLRAAVQAWAGAAGLGDDATYDLQLAVGEAAANAVEHAYRDRPVGSMDVELVDGPGSVRVRVRDHGSWRPVPDARGFRGRGLDLIREVGDDVVVAADEDGPGTEVRFVFPTQPAVPPTSTGAPPRHPAAPITPTTLRTEPSGAAVEVIGDLDLAGVQAVRAGLLERVRAGTATVDLRGTAYLASAGVALLAEADRVARGAGHRLRLVAHPGGAVRRMLELAGIDRVVEVSSPPR